jgi:hypothetical protein
VLPKHNRLQRRQASIPTESWLPILRLILEIYKERVTENLLPLATVSIREANKDDNTLRPPVVGFLSGSRPELAREILNLPPHNRQIMISPYCAQLYLDAGEARLLHPRSDEVVFPDRGSIFKLRSYSIKQQKTSLEQSKTHSLRHSQCKLCPITRHIYLNLSPVPTIYDSTTNGHRLHLMPRQVVEAFASVNCQQKERLDCKPNKAHQSHNGAIQLYLNVGVLDHSSPSTRGN